MLGWNISVHRQNPVSTKPGVAGAPQGTLVAVWQANARGLQWIDDLADEGKAISLGGSGYPYSYTAPAEVVLSRIIPKPPYENEIWQAGQGDIVENRWAGRTMIDHTAAEACQPDEWLLIEAWDES